MAQEAHRTPVTLDEESAGSKRWTEASVEAILIHLAAMAPSRG